MEDRASQAGASHSIVEDLKDDFVKNYVFPMFRGNAIYEGEYLLGTSIARPLIAKRLVEIARERELNSYLMGLQVRETIRLDLN